MATEPTSSNGCAAKSLCRYESPATQPVAKLAGLCIFVNLISVPVRYYYSTKGVLMKDEGSQVAYRDSHGNIISGVVVGYDNHLRYLVRVSGSGKFDPLAIVPESNLVH